MTIILSSICALGVSLLGGWLTIRRTTWYVTKRVQANENMRVGAVFREIKSSVCDGQIIGECYLREIRGKWLTFESVDGKQIVRMTFLQWRNIPPPVRLANKHMELTMEPTPVPASGMFHRKLVEKGDG